jgi:hypothetical protein
MRIHDLPLQGHALLLLLILEPMGILMVRIMPGIPAAAHVPVRGCAVIVLGVSGGGSVRSGRAFGCGRGGAWSGGRFVFRVLELCGISSGQGRGRAGAYHVVQRFFFFVGLHLALVPWLIGVGGHGVVLLAVGHDVAMY